jgi:hypothetical protein
MIRLFCFVLAALASPFKSKVRLEAENAVLRHQLNVLRRRLHGRVRLTNHDRWFFIQLYRWFPSILKVLTIIRPETLVRWHRAGFRCYCSSFLISLILVAFFRGTGGNRSVGLTGPRRRSPHRHCFGSHSSAGRSHQHPEMRGSMTTRTSAVTLESIPTSLTSIGKDATDHRRPDTSRTPGRSTPNAGRNGKHECLISRRRLLEHRGPSPVSLCVSAQRCAPRPARPSVREPQIRRALL